MEPWTCTRCGECCTTPPFVTVTTQERAILENRGPAVFVPDDKVGFSRMLAAPCPFYADGCTVYDVRPLNCRRYASMKGYTGSARDARRVQVHIQRKAHARWGHAHGWTADA